MEKLQLCLVLFVFFMAIILLLYVFLNKLNKRKVSANKKDNDLQKDLDILEKNSLLLEQDIKYLKEQTSFLEQELENLKNKAIDVDSKLSDIKEYLK